eukprot:752528-Hanusia_phi.AAC.5
MPVSASSTSAFHPSSLSPCFLILLFSSPSLNPHPRLLLPLCSLLFPFSSPLLFSLACISSLTSLLQHQPPPAALPTPPSPSRRSMESEPPSELKFLKSPAAEHSRLSRSEGEQRDTQSGVISVNTVTAQLTRVSNCREMAFSVLDPQLATSMTSDPESSRSEIQPTGPGCHHPQTSHSQPLSHRPGPGPLSAATSGAAGESEAAPRTVTSTHGAALPSRRIRSDDRRPPVPDPIGQAGLPVQPYYGPCYSACVRRSRCHGDSELGP